MVGLGVSGLQKTARLHFGPEEYVLYDVVLVLRDHFLVIVKIQERELRTKKGVKGWAFWAPKIRS